jgi:putative PIN family toxin of toxin-antitoxin system
MQPVVIDTNIALDVLVFPDAAAAPLREGLQAGAFRWLATPAMREELARVLGYPKLAARMAFHGAGAGAVLQAFDAQVQLVDAPARAPWRCTDPDDQKFIDLAVAHRCMLLSKDRAVLKMRKRLLEAQVVAQPAL